jgi:hypothetical protein
MAIGSIQDFDLIQAAVKVMVEVFSCVLWCWA